MIRNRNSIVRQEENVKRVVILAVIFTLLSTSGAFAASARWQALGNEHRFIVDTSNYCAYPGRMHQFTNALFIIPTPTYGNNNLVSGILVEVVKDMSLAFHYNLASPGISNLNATLKDPQYSTPRLMALNIRNFPDVFWGIKSGSTSFGARIVVGMDGSSDDTGTPTETSARAIDLSGGITTKTGMGDLDIGVGVGIQSFSDDDGTTKTESTGGFGLYLDARLHKQMDDGKFLIPIASVSFGSHPTPKEVCECSFMTGEIGLGIRRQAEKTLLVSGIVLGMNSSTETPKSGAEITDTVLSAKVLGGYEMPLTKWLYARGGANAIYTSTTLQVDVSGQAKDVKSQDVNYYYNMGLRAIYKTFILDMIISRDAFHRGPYFISGSGANLGANICITYLIKQAAKK